MADRETLPPTDAALLAVYQIHRTTGGDPRLTYVAAMTAAAISGHVIERTREQMHETLDEVMDVALAKMLAVTEVPQ